MSDMGPNFGAAQNATHAATALSFTSRRFSAFHERMSELICAQPIHRRTRWLASKYSIYQLTSDVHTVTCAPVMFTARASYCVFWRPAAADVELRAAES